jgi:DNA-binding CsgD family transcriptional regulator
MADNDNGEIWKPIEYPHFRQSEFSNQAWKYVSSRGRLMAGDGRILEATVGKGYCRTSLSIHIEGAYAGSTMVPLHRIVAYTFLGSPPTPLHTVDHINRVREDNRASNLKWASPREQLTNREFSRYIIRTVVQGQTQVFDSLTAVSNEHGIGLATLSALVRHAQPGDQFDINGVHIHMESVVRKDVCPVCPVCPTTQSRLTNQNQKYGGSPKTRETSRKHVALKMYIDGATVHEISTDMQIKPQTVYQYLGQAARESTSQILHQLATRMNMTCTSLRDRLEKDLAEFHQSLKLQNQNQNQNQHQDQNKRVEKEEYGRRYQAIVAKHLPVLKNDWKLVKETFRVIHKFSSASSCLDSSGCVLLEQDSSGCLSGKFST